MFLVSKFTGLSFSVYCFVREHYCSMNHSHLSCTECTSIVKVGNLVLKNGMVPLALAFRTAFPTVTYHPFHAKRRLLQMPLVAIRITKDKVKQQSELYLLEKIEGFDYEKLANFISRNVEQLQRKQGITKEELKQLFEITERELIRYAVYKASGTTSTGACHLYGFLCTFDACVKEAQKYMRLLKVLLKHKTVLSLILSVLLKVAALMRVVEKRQTVLSQSVMPWTHGDAMYTQVQLPTTSSLNDSECNWFEFVEKVGEMTDFSDIEVSSMVDNFFSKFQI